jgi:hypothetical protein
LSPGAAKLARAAAGSAAVALTAAHLFWLARDLRNAREVLATGENLRKLAALTIRNFPDRNLDSPELFWKAIGREGNPMHDAWGTEYRVGSRDEAGQKAYFWTSAGPDRRFDTRDDVQVAVPYASGLSSDGDLAPGEPAVPPPVSTDAK